MDEGDVQHRLDQQLRKAVVKEDRDAVRKFIGRGADVRIPGSVGSTVLHLASSQGSEAMVRLLLRRGAVVDAQDWCGMTPLHAAAFAGNATNVSVLVRARADLEIVDDFGKRALDWARVRNNDECRAVLESVYEAHGMPLDAPPPHEAALMREAASLGKTTAILDLLKSARSSKNLTPEELVRSPGCSGLTPLHFAAWSVHPEAVRIYLTAAADPNRTTPRGWTPLHFCAHFGSHDDSDNALAIVTMLLDAGADIARRTCTGASPIDLASKRKAHKMVGILKQYRETGALLPIPAPLQRLADTVSTLLASDTSASSASVDSASSIRRPASAPISGSPARASRAPPASLNIPRPSTSLLGSVIPLFSRRISSSDHGDDPNGSSSSSSGVTHRSPRSAFSFLSPRRRSSAVDVAADPAAAAAAAAAADAAHNATLEIEVIEASDRLTDSLGSSHGSASRRKARRDSTQTMAKRFSRDQLRTATDDFSSDRLVGLGAFGAVYRGALADGTHVAVKRLGDVSLAADEFAKEAATLMRLHHRHLVTFVGVCNDTIAHERFVLGEFMPTGSLRHCLDTEIEAAALASASSPRPSSAASQRSSLLPWPLRVRIALDCARGLAFLHAQSGNAAVSSIPTPLLHLHLKSRNILLDEHFVAKISDFGFVSADAALRHASPGYTCPEFLRTRVPMPSADVYSFGIIVLELLTGMTALSDKLPAPGELKWWVRKHHDSQTSTDSASSPRERSRTHLARTTSMPLSPHSADSPSFNRLLLLLDRHSALFTPRRVFWDDNVATRLFTLGLRCSADNNDRRPSADQVVDSLANLVRSLSDVIALLINPTPAVTSPRSNTLAHSDNGSLASPPRLHSPRHRSSTASNISGLSASSPASSLSRSLGAANSTANRSRSPPPPRRNSARRQRSANDASDLRNTVSSRLVNAGAPGAIQCVASGCRNVADAVNLPCQHVLLCRNCAETFRTANGPICNGCRQPSELLRPVTIVRCDLCLKECTALQLHEFGSCGHLVCRPCALEHVRFALASPIDLFPMTCPAADGDRACNTLVSSDAVEDLGGDYDAGDDSPVSEVDRDANRPLSEDELHKFREFARVAIMPATERARCPYRDCGALLRMSEDLAACHLSPSACVSCTFCRRDFCLACAVPWHAGKTCEIHALSRTQSLSITRRPASKPCPQCNAPTAHYAGHGSHLVTCPVCDHAFCFSCLGIAPCPSCALFCDLLCACADCPSCTRGETCVSCNSDWRCAPCAAAPWSSV